MYQKEQRAEETKYKENYQRERKNGWINLARILEVGCIPFTRSWRSLLYRSKYLRGHKNKHMGASLFF
jgi:hypothetical protein